MLDRYRKFQRLSRTEQKLFFQALAVLPAVALSHRLFGFTKAHSFLCRRKQGRNRAVNGTAARAASSARMIAAAARHGGVRANCLERSQALWWMLKRQGIVSDLRIGVSKSQGDFAAHAWVEWQGRVLNDGSDVRERFAAFERPVITMGANSK